MDIGVSVDQNGFTVSAQPSEPAPQPAPRDPSLPQEDFPDATLPTVPAPTGREREAPRDRDRERPRDGAPRGPGAAGA
jgi:hypothetical protein